MSLLLDALQRASKEKEKAAQAAQATLPVPPPDRKPDNPPSPFMALEPVLSPPEPPLAEPIASTADASAFPSLDAASIPLANVAEKPGTPVQPAQSGVAKPLAMEPLTSAPAASPEAPVAAPSPEASEPAPPPPKPEPAPPAKPSPATTSFVKPSPTPEQRAQPQLSPQIAREIIGASTAHSRPQRSKRPLLFIAIAAVLALSLGGLFLVQQLNTPVSTLIPPPQAQQPQPDPSNATATATAPATSANPAEQASPTALVAHIAPSVSAPTTVTPAVAEPANKAPTPVTAPIPAAEPPAATQRSNPAASTARPVFVAKPGSSATLDAAYAALNEGRLEAAAESYRRALRSNPDERDALLGLAYLAHRQGQRDAARAYYQQVLRQQPDHPVANAGLLTLAEGDPEHSVSRARDMADKAPDSAATQSALGSALARDGQLADAQQAFFKAMSLEPENPIHAFNLAVALDRLHKSDLAKTYYERALTLAEKANAGLRQSFPRQAVLNRLEQFAPRHQPPPVVPARSEDTP